MIRGESYSIGVYFNPEYDLSNISELQLSINKTVFGKLSDNTLKLVDGVFRLELSSEQTNQIPIADNFITLLIDDKVIGVRKPIIGNLIVDNTLNVFTNGSKNLTYNMLIGVNFVQEVITIQSTIIERILVGKNNYELYLSSTTDNPVKTLEEWLDSMKGVDGASPYDIAVAQGFEGTEEQFNIALLSVVLKMNIDGSNSNVDALKFMLKDLADYVSPQAGELKRNPETDTLEYGEGDGSTIDIGQEVVTAFEALSDLGDGMFIKYGGSIGNSGKIKGDLADSSALNFLFGITRKSVLSGALGKATKDGNNTAERLNGYGSNNQGVEGIDWERCSAGDVLYQHPVIAGELTAFSEAVYFETHGVHHPQFNKINKNRIPQAVVLKATGNSVKMLIRIENPKRLVDAPDFDLEAFFSKIATFGEDGITFKLHISNGVLSIIPLRFKFSTVATILPTNWSQIDANNDIWSVSLGLLDVNANSFVEAIMDETTELAYRNQNSFQLMANIATSDATGLTLKSIGQPYFNLVFVFNLING